MKRNAIRVMSSVLLLFFAFAQPALSQGRAIDDSFNVEGIRWNNSGQTILLYTIGENKGKTIVCGVYLNEGPVPEIAVRKVLQSGSVRVGRKAIVSNLSFFRKVSVASELRKTRAPCRVSRAPWKEAYAKTEPTLRFNTRLIEF